jgi:ubiquitin-conjugating enzyme E2 D/E
VHGVTLVESDSTQAKIHVKGPAHTPFKGGKFVLSVVFGDDYPFTAPSVKVNTKIYHP